MRANCPALLLLIFLVPGCSFFPTPELKAGRWEAWLDSPGGPLRFGVEIIDPEGDLKAFLINGSERVPVETASFDKRLLRLGIDRYDAEIVARIDPDGGRFDGKWSRTAGPDTKSTLPFHATLGGGPKLAQPAPPVASVSGRWAVDFSEDDDPSVGLFEMRDDGSVEGTFLNTAGDYRFLAGRMDGDRLSLSTFDGAHAFLFVARLSPDGTLEGDFWSRDTWHETWTARPDPDVSLPDPFAQTRWTAEFALSEFSFPDPDGHPHALDATEFSGRARLLVIFGSWCPNCNDATEYLVELDRRYRDKGLSILGLAFEMTGTFDRDAAQVRLYADHHGIEYPLLVVAGKAQKADASDAFPLIDRVRAFPTILFLDADNRVRAIHSGYRGPATGEAFDEQCAVFENLIEGLLGLTDPADGRSVS